MKLFLALMFASSAVMAQDCKYDGSQLEMNACAVRDYQEADYALNQAYFNRMHKLKAKKDMDALQNEQRVWIQRRDARCKLKPDEGSNAKIEYLTCLQNYTDVRTLQLR